MDEWCTFIKNAEIEAKTPIGDLLNAEGAFDEAKAAAVKAAKNAPKPKPQPTSTVTNSLGLSVGTGKAGASQDYFDFASCFEPYCAKTLEAEKLREEGMVDADPNGNGLCSLAEIETFVLKRLLAKFPNTGKGKALKTPGKVHLILPEFCCFYPSNPALVSCLFSLLDCLISLFSIGHVDCVSPLLHPRLQGRGRLRT